MSRICQITGAKPSVGNTRSHALNANKRRFLPNLQTKKVMDPSTGRMKRMKLTTSALRTLSKNAA